MSIAPTAASARVAAPPAWTTTARSKPFVLFELKRLTDELFVLRLLFGCEFLQQVLLHLLSQLLFEFTGFARIFSRCSSGIPSFSPTSSLARPPPRI